MGLNFENRPGGGDFEPHPQGAHAARIVRIVDLGTQMTSFQGQTKFQPKVMIAWETSHLIESGEHKGKPSMISSRYTASMHEKAQLRQMIESWKGMKMSEDAARKFKLADILGKTCMINIIHSVRDGKTYANVQSVMKLPPGMKAPDPVASSYLFDLDQPDQAIFDTLSPRVQELIKSSPEYEAWQMRASSRSEPVTADGGDDDSDIPF
jgi:hypothetical protein